MRGARTLIVAVSLLVATTGRAWADEKASLENVLLMEQLADVATTQQLLHAASCGPKVPVRSEFLGVIGTIRHCAIGSETDPLARPFVSTPLLNVGAALAVNGLLRLAARGLGLREMRWLRWGVELYPGVVAKNVSSTFHVQRFPTTITLSLSRRL